MRKQVVALMDSDRSYTMRFMDYVNRKKSAPFEISAFTDTGQLRKYLENHYVELLLISESDAAGETEGFPAGMTILLTKETGAHSGGQPAVRKYQSVSDVMREVLQIYSMKEKNSPGTLIKPRTNVIGVFSPVGRCGKTSFALALCLLLGRRKACLYINMETCPGLPEDLLTDSGHDMSELIYYIRQSDPNIKVKLLTVIRESRNISLIPPCPQTSELFGVTASEWRMLLKVIRTETPYEAVVLDMGEIPHVEPGILSECDEIYMPTARGTISDAKIKRFFDAAGAGAESAGDRIHLICLPDDSEAGRRGRWFQQLTCSAVGKAASECIQSQGL